MCEFSCKHCYFAPWLKKSFVLLFHLCRHNYVFYSSIGKGVPNNIAVSNNQTTPISASLVPSVEAAVDSYHEHQGHLTIESQFGTDPLRERQDLILLREQQFLQRYSFEDIFTNSISGDRTKLVNSICFFIDITIRFSNLL